MSIERILLIAVAGLCAVLVTAIEQSFRELRNDVKANSVAIAVGYDCHEDEE